MSLKRLLMVSVMVGGVLQCGSSAVAQAPAWVDASTFGYNPVDATDALQAAISSGASTVFVPNMGTPWTIRPVYLTSSNQEIIFEDGVLVQARAGYFYGEANLFRISYKSNVTLSGYGATFRMRKEDYIPQGTEHLHGLGIFGSDNVNIHGMRIENTGGDGIYLGTKTSAQNRDITIRDVILEDNYRQGISVISAENLLVENVIMGTTQGHAPQAGIDFEPNQAGQSIVNVTVRNSIIESNGGFGVLAFLDQLDGPPGETSGRIENNTIINNGEAGIYLSQALPNWTFQDNLIVGNGTFGMQQRADPFGETDVAYTAFWGNGGTTSNIDEGAGVLTNVSPIFASTDINDPRYMYLADNSPAAIRHGASDGGYLGARPIWEGVAPPPGSEPVWENATALPNPPYVNSASAEFGPTVAPDGDLYFSYGVNQNETLILRSTPTGDGWTERNKSTQLLQMLDRGKHNRDPFFSPNGTTFYFSSNNDEATWGGNEGELDIFYSTLSGSTWNTPVNLGPVINGSGDERGPHVSADGLTLTFDSDGDIYQSTWSGSTWGARDSSPFSNINTAGSDGSPSISLDGQVLYFNRGDKIYRSEWDEDTGTWGPGVDMQDMITGDDIAIDQRDPFLLGEGDGETLYFSQYLNPNSWQISSASGAWTFTPGDFTLDGYVDGADFLLWQRRGSPDPLSASDLADWEANFGTQPVVTASSAVPEPAALTLLLGTSLTLGLFRRHPSFAG